MASDKEKQSQLEEGDRFNSQLRKRVDTLQEDLEDITKLISKLGDLANTLQKESNAVRDAINKQLQQDVNTLQNEYNDGRKREEALNIEIKEGAQSRHQLREDINALQDDYVTNRKDQRSREMDRGKRIRHMELELEKLRDGRRKSEVSINKLEAEYDEGHKREEALNVDRKERNESRNKLREDVNALQDEYVINRKDQISQTKRFILIEKELEKFRDDRRNSENTIQTNDNIGGGFKRLSETMRRLPDITTDIWSKLRP